MDGDGDEPTNGMSLRALERAVLTVLYDGIGRVHSRWELARRVGIADRHERRCDAVVVELRKRLGSDAIVTVRSRGWMLDPSAAERAVALLSAD